MRLVDEQHSRQADVSMEAVPLKSERKPATYEEAIEATSVGKFNYFLLMICGLCYTAGGVEVGGHSVLILAAECDLNLTLHDKGLLVAVGFCGSILSLPVLGYLSDTYGRIRTMKTTLIGSVCMSVLSAFSVNTTMLILLRFLTCVLISATQSSVFTLITEFNSNKTRLRHLTILAAFVFAGTFYFRAMTIVHYTLNLKSYIPIAPWRLLVLIYSIPSLLALIGLVFLPESPKFLLLKGRHEECMTILKKVFHTNTGKPKMTFPHNEVTFEEPADKIKPNSLKDTLLNMGKQTVQLFEGKLLFRTAHINFIVLNTAIIGGGVAMWMPSILTDVMGSDNNVKTVCGSVMLRATRSQNETATSEGQECTGDLNILPFVVMSIVSICMFAISLVTSTIVNLIGRNGLIVMWLLLSSMSSFAVYVSETYSINILALTLIINAVTINGNIYGVASEIYPTRVNSMGVSLVIMMTYIGCLLGSYFVGPLVLYYCYQTFLVFGCLLVLVIVLVFLLPNNRNAK